MTELARRVLLAQLRRLDAILERLRANKRLFKSLIADLPGPGVSRPARPRG